MYIKKQYKTFLSTHVDEFENVEISINLQDSPESDMGWIIIAPGTTSEETCFFHRSVGNTVFVHWVNRTNPHAHDIGTLVYYASTIDYLNYLLSRQNNQMFIYKKTDDNIVVVGGEFYVWGIYTVVPSMDTSLGLPNQTLLLNTTSFIHLENGIYTIAAARNNSLYYVWSVVTDVGGNIASITHANVTHLSTKGDKGDQWDPGPTGPIGPAGIIWRWDYSAIVSYLPTMVVKYQGQLYYNKLASTGVLPTVGTNWDLFVPKSDLTLGLIEDSFIDSTSSTFTLTQVPFSDTVVYVFIRQRKAIVGIDYTYSNLTNSITLLPAAISVDPQTIQILYATSGVSGSGSSDHFVLADVTDTIPGTLFDKILSQWDLTVQTLEPAPGNVKILISAPERTYTSTDSSVTITPSEFTDIDWLIHKNIDLSAPGSGGGWATSTTVNGLTFAFDDELNITSTDTSVGVTTTQNVDGDVNIDLSVVIPDTTINGLTFDLADTLTIASSDSSVTITPTQDVAGNININLAAASGSSFSWAKKRPTSFGNVATNSNVSVPLGTTDFVTEAWYDTVVDRITIPTTGRYRITWIVYLSWLSTWTMTKAILRYGISWSSTPIDIRDMALVWGGWLWATESRTLSFTIIEQMTAWQQVYMEVETITSVTTTIGIAQNRTYLTVEKLS